MTSDERLRKNERLLKSRDFRKAYKGGRSYRMGFMAAYRIENGLAHNRIGFSISSRNIKKANSRNRIRRLFKEACRKTKGRLKPGFDMVLVVRREVEPRFAYRDAEAIFLKLAKGLGIYKPTP